MFKRFFSKDINIPTLRLSGVIGQAGIARSGLTITGVEKLIDKLDKFSAVSKVDPDRYIFLAENAQIVANENELLKVNKIHCLFYLMKYVQPYLSA